MSKDCDIDDIDDDDDGQDDDDDDDDDDDIGKTKGKRSVTKSCRQQLRYCWLLQGSETAEHVQLCMVVVMMVLVLW